MRRQRGVLFSHLLRVLRLLAAGRSEVVTADHVSMHMSYLLQICRFLRLETVILSECAELWGYEVLMFK